MLLKLLSEAYIDISIKMPKNYCEASKITNVFGMECKTWDACPNNCMIYKGLDEGLNEYGVCKVPRFTTKYGRKALQKREINSVETKIKMAIHVSYNSHS